VGKKQVIFALANVAMFPITASLTPYETWIERDIRQRQAEMLNLLRQGLTAWPVGPQTFIALSQN
jgi:hypothetical protein